MGLPARKIQPATYADLAAVPDHLRAELIEGSLHTAPRPGLPHQLANGRLFGTLDRTFHHGGGGPSGWIILIEVELHLGQALGHSDPRDAVVVPDISGWRRSRLPQVPRSAALSLPPDWVCEVISPRREAHDRIRKMDLYQRAGIPWYWLLDPAARTLEVFRLDDGPPVRVVGHEGGGTVRAPPFESAELDASGWWLPDEEEAGEGAPGAGEEDPAQPAE